MEAKHVRISGISLPLNPVPSDRKAVLKVLLWNLWHSEYIDLVTVK